MNPLFQRFATSGLRYLALLAAPWLISHGFLNQSESVELAAEISVVGAAILWGFWTHYKSLQKENTSTAMLNALSGPQVRPMTSADVTAVIKRGDAASTLTPPTVPPTLTGTGAGLMSVVSAGSGRSLGIVLAIGLSVGALAGCAHGTNLPHISSTPVAVADVEGKRLVVKSVRVIDSIGKFTAELSKAERELHEGGAVRDTWHQEFRIGITAFSREAIDTLDRIERELLEWAAVKPLLDRLIAKANGLIDLINSAPSKAKSVLSDIFDQVLTGFGEFAFGGSR